MRKIVCVLFFITSIICKAQNNFDVGFLPKIVISKSLSKKTKWVNSIESRATIYDESFQFKHDLVDLSSIISFKSGYNQSINLGYIVRFRGERVIHRTFQHYNIVQTLNAAKLAHRFALEQFFENNRSLTHRTRYRINYEKSLNGERIDAKEFYIKLGNEYLYDFNNDLEIRLTPFVGFQISKNEQIEFGLDYRLSEYLTSQPQHVTFFRTTWYINL